MNKDYKNILEQEELKKSPFTLPEGYFSQMEDGVRERISANGAPKSSTSWGVLKPAFALVCSFLLIFGIGYGVLQMTNTLSSAPDNDGMMADITDNYFGFDDLFSDENKRFDEEGDDMDENTKEIITYLGSEISPYELSNIYANLLE